MDWGSEFQSNVNEENNQCPVGKQIETLQLQISDQTEQFENKINSNFRPQSLPSTCESNGTVAAVLASQIIKEYRDRESRKLNVILHNVPESDSAEASTRITHDTNIVADIADKIGIGPVDVSTVVHLGEKLQGRSRLLKVHLCNLQHKHLLLSNAKKLSGNFFRGLGGLRFFFSFIRKI